MDNHLQDDCLTAQTLFDKRLDESPLTTAETAFLDRHLTSCTLCARSAREMQAMLSSFKHFEEVPVPADLTDRIMARIEREPARMPKRFPVAIAAALTLVVVAVGFFALQKPAEDTPGVIASFPEKPPVEQVTSPAAPVETHPETQPITGPSSPQPATGETGTPPASVRTSGTQVAELPAGQNATATSASHTPRIIRHQRTAKNHAPAVPVDASENDPLVAMASPDGSDELFNALTSDEETVASAQQESLGDLVGF